MGKSSALRVLGVLLTTAALAACNNKINNQERKLAPTGKNDVGVLVETKDRADIEQILKNYPEAQVRNLNPQHGLYEIFGVTLEQAQQIAPAANVSLNNFYEFKPFSLPGPAGLKVQGLKPCKAAQHFPTAVLSLLEPSGPASPVRTVEVGQTLKLSSLRSKASLLAPGALNTVFVMVPPTASSLGQQVSQAKEIELKPDALGSYNVFVVVQDSRDVCAIDGVNIIATANRPFQPSQQNLRIDISLLTHLQKVSAQESWAISQGEGVTIAVVDSGVNYNHPLIAPNILLNSRDADGDGKDSDNNGFADDHIGYDFVNSDGFPYDDDGHGSHVAGLAAAKQFGMAPKAKVLAIKAMTSIGGDAGSIAAAIAYATDRGARIINLSLGTIAPAPHPLIKKAVDYAESKGVLLVVAVGNGDPRSGLGMDLETQPVFPASLPNSNILTVAASSAGEVLAPYSNYGVESVDVVAPGGLAPSDPMISLSHEVPGRARLAAMSGTSMASPVVAGIAAQVLAYEPGLKASEIRQILIESGDEVPELKAVTVSGRHLNAKAALMRSRTTGVLF